VGRRRQANFDKSSRDAIGQMYRRETANQGQQGQITISDRFLTSDTFQDKAKAKEGK
jgi:hypothetical protein